MKEDKKMEDSKTTPLYFSYKYLQLTTGEHLIGVVCEFSKQFIEYDYIRIILPMKILNIYKTPIIMEPWIPFLDPLIVTIAFKDLMIMENINEYMIKEYDKKIELYKEVDLSMIDEMKDSIEEEYIEDLEMITDWELCEMNPEYKKRITLNYTIDNEKSD